MHARVRRSLPLVVVLAMAPGLAAQQAGLTPGTFVAATFGWNNVPQPAGNSIHIVDMFARTATPLTIAGYPSAPGEIPVGLQVESRLSFLLGTQFHTAQQTIINGNVYRVAWRNGGFVATRLNVNVLGEGVVAITTIGSKIYFTTSGLFATGQTPSCKLWSMPRDGGTATVAVDMAAIGAPGIWGALAPLGSTLHLFTFVSFPSGAGEHWAIDTTVTPPATTRIGLLPPSIRSGAVGNPIGALSATWDARTGAFVIPCVYGDVLWRDPVGHDVHQRAIPSQLSNSNLSDFWGAGALDTDTGAVILGDKARHIEELRAPNARFFLNQLALPAPLPSFSWVVGLAYVPGAARYLPDGPDSCPQAIGYWPSSYANSRPARGNAGFAFTLDAVGTSATLLFGFDNVSWGANLLPFDLAPLGAPGCVLGTSADITVVTGAPLSVPVALPNMFGTFYTQWAIFDPANPLGVVLSDARRVEIR